MGTVDFAVVSTPAAAEMHRSTAVNAACLFEEILSRWNRRLRHLAGRQELSFEETDAIIRFDLSWKGDGDLSVLQAVCLLSHGLEL